MALVNPHGGGSLRPLLLEGQALQAELARARSLPRLKVSSREKGDIIMLGIGGFNLDTDLLAADGIPLEIVSAGGSPTLWQAHTHKEVTEHRAGTYVYGDRSMVNAGVMTPDQVAFHVIATVVSRPPCLLYTSPRPRD